MDYEKKYKNAIKRADTLLKLAANKKEAEGYVSTIFPEFIERDDERIREEILNYLIWLRDFRECGYAPSGKYDISDMIAWLEKLDEQKLSWSEEDEKMFNSALWHVKNSCSNSGKNSGEFEVYNWLKSLKDRV